MKNFKGLEFAKKQTITILEVKEEGMLVHNTGDTSDQWVIPHDVFNATYVEVK